MNDNAVKERAEELLVALRQSLAVDGYTMDIEPTPAGIHVLVDVAGDSCPDCLVPREIFRGIVETVLGQGGLSVGAIDVTYPESESAH